MVLLNVVDVYYYFITEHRGGRALMCCGLLCCFSLLLCIFIYESNIRFCQIKLILTRCLCVYDDYRRIWVEDKTRKQTVPSVRSFARTVAVPRHPRPSIITKITFY